MKYSFLYLHGPPRSGTTYLANLVNSSDSVVVLNEFPVFNYLHDGGLRHFLKRLADDVQLAVRRASILDSHDMNDLLSLIQGEKYGPLLNQEEGAALKKAERWFSMANFLMQKFETAELSLDEVSIDGLFFDFLISSVIKIVDPSAAHYSHIALKLPGWRKLYDFRALRLASEDFRSISVFRDPKATSLSSLERFLSTQLTTDNWHLADAAESVQEWIKTFYYCRQVHRDLQSRSLVLFYENFQCGTEFDVLERFIAPARLKRLPFHAIAETKSRSEDIYGAAVDGWLSDARIPHGQAWTNLARDGVDALMSLEPVMVHDLDALSLADERCPIVTENFDSPEPDGAWTLDAAASILFFTPERYRKAKIVVSLNAWPESMRENSLSIYLNGSLVVHSRVHRSVSEIVYDPPAVVKQQLTLPADGYVWSRLDIRLGSLHRVQGDVRSLGIKVGGIRFTGF